MMPDMVNERDYVNQSGLSRQAILNQVEASLARLETDYIDLLQIHRADLDNTSAEVRMSLYAMVHADLSSSRRPGDHEGPS
jgi:aryl-alcohol dehydrogenase-like predicted oxidoreductase